VARIEDVPNDAQAIASGALVAFENSSLMTVSSPFWLAGQDKVQPRHAPAIGEHNEVVLAGIGYDAAEIAGLRAAGVIA
jgi:crotonobetainyl-CoA:carnitine CoA-transferase CaiB-like acyl-CoA transferase